MTRRTVFMVLSGLLGSMSALASDPPPHASTGRTIRGVTYTRGATSVPGVTFTPGARLSPPPAPHAAHPPTPGVHVAPRAETPATPRAPAGAYGCALAAPIAYTDLDAPGLRAVQLVLASRGDRTVALVAMARHPGPRQIRQGLSYPESRVVVLGSSGEPTVLHAPGFEPDAAIALGPNDHTLVVSYAAGESARVQESVRVSLLDAHGALAAPARTVENSAGLKVDSPATAWREGYAVVLGRETAGDTMREAIYGFDRQGEANHAPWALTDAQGDDSIGRYRVGLAAANDGAVLRASWTVVAAAQAGVWTRTLNDGHLDEPRRLAARPAWGSEVMPDGGGILYRAGGERSAPVELFFAPAEAGDSVSLGAGWDPSTAYVRGHLLVAGVTLADADGHDLNTLVAAALPGQPLRAIPADRSAGDALATAVDYDIAASPDGATVAWLDSVDSDARRLAWARVRCE